MGKLHLSFEELSALFDGELPAPAETSARQHLRECPQCSAEYSLSVRLERDLRQPPVLACESALELLSARFDGQASQADRAAGERHLAACEGCRVRVQVWASVGNVLRTLPAGRPSASVDRAIAHLANPPRRVGVRAFPGLLARVGIAGAAILAVILSGVPLTQAPTGTPAIHDGGSVVVAAAQQIVYNAKNNTFYVLDTATAAVNAREPGTNALIARIPVGGEPIRLTLKEATNTILVLDAAQKRVTEIDAESNTVIDAKTVDVVGTPTSINIDTTGQIVVTSVPTPDTGAPAPVGTVSVLDATTKELKIVREIDVAPRMVVVDPLSNQAVLVSSGVTKLVDSSYKVIGTLPGGVAAAFSRKGDGLAVLSATGTDTTVTFAGALAPAALQLQGSPRAITALRGGGYLVLLQVEGQGRVVKVTADGRAEGSTSVAVAGGDLLYDEATNFFTVANGGTVATAQVPAEPVAAASAAPSPSASTALSSPAVSPSVTSAPSASPEPTQQPSASPAAVVSAADVLSGAKSISAGLFSLPLPSDVRPHLMTASGTRVWFIDQASRVGSLDMSTGELKIIAKLRADARVGFWVAGRSFVFGVDPASGQVHVINTVTESVDSYPTNVLSPVSAVAVGPDDRLWIALRDASYMLQFDPTTHGMDSFDLGSARVSALAVDSLGRVTYADDVHATVGTFDPKTMRAREVIFNRRGTTTALVIDASGTLWLGTSTGDLYSVKDSRPGLAINVRMPVSTLALDESGRAWFLAPIPNGIVGFGYAPTDGSQAVKSIPGPAVGLAFSPSGRAFSADPRGSFYVGTGDSR